MEKFEPYKITADPCLILPSGLRAELDDMDGRDQEAMSNRAKIKSGTAINEILARRMKINGKEITSKDAELMLSGDRAAAYIHLRRLSFGDNWTFDQDCANEDCPRHREPFRASVEMQDSDIQIEPYPQNETKRVRIDVFDPGKNQNRTIEIGLMTGKEERAILKINGPGTTTLLQIRKPVDIRDESEKGPKRIGIDFFNEKLRFIVNTNRALREFEPDLSHLTVDVWCPDCGAKNTVDILSNPYFLFPQLISGKTPI